MHNKLKDLSLIIAAVATIAVFAQMTIDVGSIPITGQTFAILFWAFFLTPKQSIIALIAYLILGFIGLPIFADGESGIEKLWGGSGGFLVGFVAGAFFVSHYHEKLKKNTLLHIILLTAIGTCIILLFGNIRLCAQYGIQNGLEYGFFPFWQGALIKVFIGSLVVWTIKKYLLKN